MKRILFLSDINSVHTRMWCENLVFEGYQISIFSLSKKESNWVDELNIEFKCFGVEQETVRSQGRFSKVAYFSANSEVRDFFNQIQPDIVHAHYASSYGTLAKQLGFKNTILSLWGSDVYDFPQRSLIHRFLFKRAVKFPKIVCSTSYAMAKESQKYVQRDYKITPFGVDCNFFEPKKVKADCLTFGTVKSLEEVYGIDRLLKSFAVFKKKTSMNAKLVIFGKGSEESNLRNLANRLGLEESVDFRGFIQKEDIVNAFNELDVFLALSRQESFGVAVLEAQACGLPVIVSNVGGLPEVVSNQTGFIVNGEKTDEIVEKMTILEQESVRKEMGENARSFVIENYSLEACLEKMVGIYNSIE